MLECLEDLLGKAQEMAENLGDDKFEPYDRLRQVLMDASIPQGYDVIVVDPPATAGPHLYISSGACLLSVNSAAIRIFEPIETIVQP